MENAGEAAVPGAQRFVLGQGFGQGPRGGAEKQVVDIFCLRPEEQRAQLRGQGEDDHEVRRRDALLQFARDPLGRVGAAALRAIAVVAAVKEKSPLATVIAVVDVPVHCQGAAMQDGPDGTRNDSG